MNKPKWDYEVEWPDPKARKQPTPLKQLIPPKEYRQMMWWTFWCITFPAIFGAVFGEMVGRHNGEPYIWGIIGFIVGAWLGAHFGLQPWIEWENWRNHRRK